MKKLLVLLLILLCAACSEKQKLDRGVKLYTEGKAQEAMAIWQPLAAEGNTDAQFYLANAYSYGPKGLRDVKLADDLFKRAAEAGHVKAQYNVGIMHLNGEGVEASAGAAATWLARSAAG